MSPTLKTDWTMMEEGILNLNSQEKSQTTQGKKSLW
jgi:hypothetical protein